MEKRRSRPLSEFILAPSAINERERRLSSATRGSAFVNRAASAPGDPLVVGYPESLPNFFQTRVAFGEEVDVFVMAEEGIDVPGLRQDVPAPAIQHRYFEEGCEVLGFMWHEKMARRFV